MSAPAAASLPLACRCCAGGRGPSQKKRLGGDNVQFWRSPSEKVGISGNDEIPEVFDTDPTKPITSWKTAWSSAKASAGIECRFHDLRHTTVTRLLERGQPFAVVAEIMGWSAATAVRMAKRYGHIGPSAKRTAMTALDEPPSESSTTSETTTPSHDSAVLGTGTTTVQ